MILRKHQARFLKEDPDKALLCWEMRTGKSLPASLWAKKRGKTLIVCPKQLVGDWEELSPFADVVSKETFKKNRYEGYDALIVDEAHTFGSALFTKNRSQLATAMYNFVRENPEMSVLLLTATPIRNDPSSLHTLLCYMGIYIPWKKWRDKFYILEKKPFIPRPAYFPRIGWQRNIKRVLEKYADIVSLKDCVDYLPPVTKEVVPIATPKYKRPDDEDEYHWTKEHLHEQSKKAEYIKSLGYRKIIVACHYTAQIDELAKSLSKEREVFVLDGRTKNPEEIKKMAQESDECYFIVQASMGFGFDGYMFGALVFASMSHKSLDHTQMLGRLTNIDKPKPLFFYYLIGGRWDKRIYKSIMLNEDFNPHVWAKQK